MLLLCIFGLIRLKILIFILNSDECRDSFLSLLKLYSSEPVAAG